jgi:hypothetical protein
MHAGIRRQVRAADCSGARAGDHPTRAPLCFYGLRFYGSRLTARVTIASLPPHTGEIRRFDPFAHTCVNSVVGPLTMVKATAEITAFGGVP